MFNLVHLKLMLFVIYIAAGAWTGQTLLVLSLKGLHHAPNHPINSLLPLRNFPNPSSLLQILTTLNPLGLSSTTKRSNHLESIHRN